MKKFLQLLLLAALMVPLGARATTDTLTVADGTATNSYVPIYGYWADADQHNQMIYPASMLTDMIGQNITGLTFYVTGSWSCDAVVSMAIVDDSTLSGYNNASLTEVWSGTWTSSTVMEFLNAFPYTGGNLLIDIQTVGDDYANSTATGISRAGAAVYAYNSNSPSVQGFLPKATFVYSDAAFCFAPSHPVLDEATTNSLSFHWSAGGTENAWEVMINDSIISPVTDTFLTVTDLNASSRYNVSVRAICGPDNTSAWISPTMMTTTCAAIANLPWSTGFEGEINGEVPLCWTRTVPFIYTEYSGDTNYGPYAYNYSYYSHSGSTSLYFYAYTGYTLISNQAIIASPYISHNPADLHVTFWANGYNVNEGDTLWAGIMTDPNDDSTFIPLTAITAEELGYGMYSTNYMQFEFYTSSLSDVFSEGDSACIAFRTVIGEGNYSMTLTIDDIVVDAMGDCLAPTLNSGNIDSISYEGVQLSWECSGEPEGYVVRLQNLMNQTYSYYESMDDSLLIENGLLPNTPYEAYVATLCGADTTSYTYIGSFTTHYRCYAVVEPTVAALTANAAALTWGFTGTGIVPTDVEVVLMDLTDSTTTTLHVTDDNCIFSGLTTGHMYEATFVTYCGDADTSWSVSVSFMPHVPACAEFAGTSTSSYIPFYGYYNNGFSEMLYNGSEFAGFDTVTGLSFEVASALNRNNTVDIWMAYVPDSVDGLTTTSFIPVDSMIHVVSDFNFSTANAGWTDMIPFDTLFPTQATGNVVIAVYNHTGSWASGLSWATHTSTVGNSIYRYTDSYIDPAAPGYNNTTPMAANIQVYGNCGGGDCVAPGARVASSDTNSVTLTWLPGGSESSWNVLYREEGATSWINAGAANTVPFTLTGLNAGTNYQFRVGSDCGDTIVYGNAITGTTACGRMHAPFSIVPTGENNCWTYTGSGYYSSYSNYYYIYSGGAIMTPVIADSINTLQVKLSVYGSLYYVGVCDANGQNIVWMDTVDPGESYDFHNVKTYLNNYSGNGTNIIIKASSGNNYTYINQITVEPLDDCMPVSNLAVDSVTTTDAWLSWTSDGNSFLVKYMDENDATGTWLTATSTTNSIHLTGMNSNTRYQVKVYNVCGATSQSDSVTTRLIMGCTPFSTPFFEGFGHDELPVCWNNVTSGNVYTTFSETAGYGYNYVYSYGSYSGAAQYDWLMTPEIQIPTNADNYRFLFYIGGGAYPYTGYSNSYAAYDLYISTTGTGDTSLYTTLLLSDTLSSRTSSGSTMLPTSVSLTPYAGQTVSLAFRARTREYGAVYLTNVEARFAGEPVYYLSGNGTVFTGESNTYVANYLEGSLDSMTYQWTSTMATAGQAVMTGANTDTMNIVYNVEGVDTLTFIATNQYGADTSYGIVHAYSCTPISTFPFHEGFEEDLSPCYTLVYGDGNPNSNTMLVTEDYGYNLDSVHEGTHAFRFSSMSSKTDYNQYLISRELNGDNMVLSFWYAKYNTNETESFRVGYSSTDRDTNSFTWGSWVSDSLSCTEWKQYTDTMPAGTKFFAIQYWGNYAYYVYIDDLTITGISGECAAPVLSSAATATETTATFSWIPSTGNYEVAFVEGAWVAPTTGTAVTDTTYTFTGLTGSTVYTLGVRAVCGPTRMSEWVTTTVTTAAHPCYAPTNVTATNVTMDGATIAWTPGEEGQTQFELQFTAAGASVNVLTTENPYVVDELLNNTEYTVMVRAICGEGNYSDWSAPATFTTAACQMVQGVNVPAATITSSSAVVNWTANGSSNYEVGYGPLGTTTDNCTRRTTTTNSYTITGLEEGTNYVVYVRSICGDGIYSDWTSGFNFMTTEVGIEDVDNTAISLYPNPASSTVTLTGIEGEATVTVVDMNGRVIKVMGYGLEVIDNSLTIDISELAQGAYFVRITGERVNAIRKLIVR